MKEYKNKYFTYLSIFKRYRDLKKMQIEGEALLEKKLCTDTDVTLDSGFIEVVSSKCLEM